MKVLDPEDVRLLMQYIEDKRSGEMIEAPGYRRDYLAFNEKGLIAQWELDELCKLAVGFVLKPEESIYNHMGEIIFTTPEDRK